MADMFGTIGGMFASQEHRRAERAADLEALKTMSEISSQPIKNQLNQAQAEQYRASAGHLEAETARLKTEQEAQEKLAAIAQLVAAKHAAGEIPTTEDLSDGRPKSLADPFQAQLELAQREGISPILTDKLATTIAGIRQKEAQAAASLATQRNQQAEFIKKRLEVRGAFAGAALQAGPGQWAQMRQMAVDRTPPGQPSELDKLPQDWNAAVPILRAALTESIEGPKQIDHELARARDATAATRAKSANARAEAAVQYARKKTEFVAAELAYRQKNEGWGSSSTKAAKGKLTEAQRLVAEARDRKEFPRFPIDPQDREYGKNYTAANGAKVKFTRDANGKDTLLILKPTSARSVPKTDDSELLNYAED